jgi:predicted MPP superfamily phosphohydrolase
VRTVSRAGRGQVAASRGGVSRGAATLGAAALGVAAWSTLVEPRLFTLRRHTLPVLPEGSSPLRVLQLSDLHLAPWQHRKIDWVRSLVELRPDLVVLTGDLMGHRFARGPLLHTLRAFTDAGVAGVFVHGSNDYYSPIAKNPFLYLSAPSSTGKRTPDLDNAALTRGMTELGLIDLNNRAARLNLRGTELEFLGLNDPHIGYDDAAALDASIAEISADAVASRTAASGGAAATPVRLGVVHAPYQHALGQLLDRNVAAIFAGHTHGGQVRVPGLGALTSNCDLPVAQARGLSVWYDAEHAAFLNVSAGLGASVFAPIRFACRPEASLITLEAER